MPAAPAPGPPSSEEPAGDVGPAWPTFLALALVLLSLATLVVTPFWTERRAEALRSEIDAVAEPAHPLAARLEFSFAFQVAGIRGFLLTTDERYLERYRSARSEEQRLFGELDRLGRRLDPEVAVRLNTVRERAARWHARQDALLAGDVSPERFAAAFEEQQALYESLLDAALALDRALMETTGERRRAIEALERRHRRLSALLASGALLAAAAVGWLAWSQRRFAASTARLYRESRAAERRWRFLAESSEILDASLDYGETLRSLARLAVPRIADGCVVDLVDAERADAVERIAVAHVDPAREERIREMRRNRPPDPASRRPAARALAAGEALLVADVGAAGPDDAGPDAAQLAWLRELDARSLIVVPLVARGTVLGAITLVSTSPERAYDAADLALAQELAGRAALAVDNARLYEAALAAGKAKSDFLAVVSHELRTPLSAITGSAELLARDVAGPLTAEQRSFVERISTNAWDQLRIIEEILTFSRMDAGREPVLVEPVDLAALARDAASFTEPLAREKGLRFRVDVPAEPLRVETDRARLRHVLVNLLSNAVKFTERGEVELRAGMEDGAATVRVRDTGIGIPPGDRERIFEPFVQLEEVMTRGRGGTGLGLAVARRLTRLLGGEVTVESEPGRGSTFTVRLPARAPGRPG